MPEDKRIHYTPESRKNANEAAHKSGAYNCNIVGGGRVKKACVDNRAWKILCLDLSLIIQPYTTRRGMPESEIKIGRIRGTRGECEKFLGVAVRKVDILWCSGEN